MYDIQSRLKKQWNFLIDKLIDSMHEIDNFV